MAKTVQFLGMTAAQAVLFTGLPRQVIVDTNAWTLRVQDGITPGGFALLVAGNNFSDIGNKTIARDNLDLGTAAIHDATDFDVAGAAAAAQATAISTTEAFATAADVVVTTNANTHADTAAATAQTAATAAAKTYADTTFLPLAGGTMTGNLIGKDAGIWGAGGLTGMKGLGIGFAGAITTIIDVRDNANNGPTVSRVQNTNAGATVTSRLRADNGTYVTDLLMFGTGWTTSGISRANGAMLYTDGVGGLTVGTTSNSPLYFIMNGAQRGAFATDGSLVIGTNTGAGVGGIRCGGALFSETTIQAVGDITSFVSDMRLKTNIKPIENPLVMLREFRGFTYELNEKGLEITKTEPGRRWLGLSAQAFEKRLPEAVTLAPGNSEYVTLKYDHLVAYLMEVNNALLDRIEALERK